LEEPEEPCREPVVVVAVGHDRRARGDAALGKERLELLLVDEIADRMLLQVGLPVQTDRSGDVTLVVRGGVHVDLEHADARILRALREPVRLDEHVVRIASHVFEPPTVIGWDRRRRSASMPWATRTASNRQWPPEAASGQTQVRRDDPGIKGSMIPAPAIARKRPEAGR